MSYHTVSTKPSPVASEGMHEIQVVPICLHCLYCVGSQYLSWLLEPFTIPRAGVKSYILHLQVPPIHKNMGKGPL